MKLILFKENRTLKGILLVLTIILGFIFMVSFTVIYVSDAIKNNNACGCVIPIPYMIFILSSLGLFVGSLSFYILISKHLKERNETSESVKSTLKFLENEERLIFQTLIKNKGKINQSAFEKLTGLHKVKVHRIIHKLESKGVINKTKLGKINKIELSDDLKEIFY